ncbi:MAG TPA: PAS domain-containing protein [Burkholderiales bacterium]|jgi:PAS domain S-box-containing protein
MTTHEVLPWQEQAEPEVGFAMDRFGNVSQMGAGWSMLTGGSPHDVLSRPFADILHPADRPPVLEALQSLIRGEIYSCRMPARCLRRDGLHCRVEIYAHPTLDADGRIAGVRGSFTDITARRKSMRALRESEARFRAISDASPLGVYVTDAAGGCIFANANFEQISGLRADQVRASGHLSTLHPEDRTRVLLAREAATRSRTPYGVDCRYLHTDATVAWTRINGAPIRDGNNLLGFVHVVEDVSAQRCASESLRRSQERLQLALEGSGDVLLDWDLRSGEVYLSEQWGQLVDGPRGAAVTTVRDLLELVHPREQPLVQQALDETLRGERPFLRVQYRVRTQTGEWKWVETHARVMERGDDGTPLRVTGTSADITDRKNLEARQAEFMATVSHELRTPLASVLGALEILREDYLAELPEDARRFIEMALRNGNQLAGLIQSVLDLERIETGVHGFDFAAVPVKELLGRALQVNEAFALKLAVRLEMDAAGGTDCYVWTDMVRALQVLTNLISNAVKFSPAGQCVTLGSLCTSDRVRLFVEDHGPGIPEDSRDCIFQRFGQASNQEHSRLPGSGLGLSICKALVTRMGGDIDLHSEIGRGSVFWIELPKAKGVAGTA